MAIALKQLKLKFRRFWLIVLSLIFLWLNTADVEALTLIVSSPEELKPLSQVLAEKIPARVRPPGELSAYSNYGVALAGYIVEQVSGMPFEQYVGENIFQPLAMDSTTFSQPPPKPLAAEMATGYIQTGNLPLPKEFEYITLFPAGSMSATATDMAKFAIALSQPTVFSYGIPSFFRIVLIIPLLNIALTIAAILFAFRLWHKGSGHFIERSHYTTVTIFLLIFLWFLDYWNLLQFSVSIT